MQHGRTSRAFPAWHYPMLNDRSRNEAIEAAIANIGVQGKRVFEIGTGAGLTAMLFARHGASRVVSCEIDPQLFEIASSIVKRNRQDDRITLINKSSTAAIGDGDIDFVPDIIFTETIDCGVVGEGFPTIARDIASVAGNQTVVLPDKIEQFGYMIECDDIYSMNGVDDVSGFDMRLLNDYSTRTYFPIRANLFRVRCLSPIHRIHTFKYRSAIPNSSVVEIEAHGAGLCHGIVTFFEARFGRFMVTNDARHAGHWHQAFHPLPEPVYVKPGLRYRALLNLNGSLSIEEMTDA
jgi:type I protein arginine methyltransferase